ncbi:MAG: LuxR C-terminal-related transcriptional regulator [Actinobacteria bacterium]|nr:LuxR C-terminal-related transcriptional regulator [Actinomycetota bacterium]
MVVSHGGRVGVDAERQRDAIDQAEQIADLGTWEWTPETGELWWSENLFRLFGLAPGEIAPSVDYAVARMVPEDRPRAERSLTALLGEGLRDPVVEYRIVGADGAVRAHRVVVVVLDCAPRRIVGSVRDVTLQRRLDRQLAAHVAVSAALAGWTSLVQGAELLLANLAVAMEFAFGVFWLPQESSLRATTICYAPSPAVTRVLELTRNSRHGPDSSIARLGSSQGHSVIATDAVNRGLGERDAAIRAAGLHGALAVPARFADQTFAVMEFLSFAPIVADERLLSAMDGIGHEVGRFLSSRSGELNAPVLTRRELEVLQLAAQGLSTAAMASQLHLSPSTLKRHFENIYAALGARDRTGAVGEAMRRGLIT